MLKILQTGRLFCCHSYITSVCGYDSAEWQKQFGGGQWDEPVCDRKSDEKNRKISLDEYGIGILAKEIEGDAEEEALKAQAVLIRTSIYKSIQDEGTSTVLTKEYWTRQQMESNWGADHYGEYYEKMKAAWMDETRGQVLMYDGRLILTRITG